MGISIYEPAKAGDIIYLGGGSGTGAAGATTNIGSFSIPADIGTGMILFTSLGKRASGAGTTNQIGLGVDPTTTAITSAAVTNPALSIFGSKAPAVGSAALGFHGLENTAVAIFNYTSSFVVNAAETFYVNVICPATTTCDVTWTAFYLKSGINT